MKPNLIDAIRQIHERNVNTPVIVSSENTELTRLRAENEKFRQDNCALDSAVEAWRAETERLRAEVESRRKDAEDDGVLVARMEFAIASLTAERDALRKRIEDAPKAPVHACDDGTIGMRVGPYVFACMTRADVGKIVALVPVGEKAEG